MTDFYAESQVREAQAMLARLREIVPGAIVLGGWAVYLYTRGQRSTDVDIAVDFEAFGRLQAAFPGQIRKNDNLRKYELVVDLVEVDILIAHFSNTGIPLESLLEPTRSVGGFRVISPEGLLAMKLCAWMDRAGRPKGDKDEADALSLLSAIDLDWEHYDAVVAGADARYAAQFPGAIGRLVTSADLRQNWRYIKANGVPLVTTPMQWKAFRERLSGRVPRGR